MNKMRVLIVEDRPFARARISYLLTKKHPDVEVVGAFEDTASARPLIEAGNIDGVFLDIHIETEGRRAGLDLAHLIDRLPDQKPWVVFTTGFEEYALPAYKAHPFDYLVKPLTDNKVAEVLERIRKARPNTGIKESPSRIEIKHKVVDRDEVIWPINFVKEDEIKCIQSNNNGNTTKVTLINGEVLDGIHKTLKEWIDEKNLPNIKRIYNSHLVNLNHVNGIRPDPFKQDCFVVTFRVGDSELPIGRKYLDALRNALRKK
jgi:DNA-binding LytR/AlgR family response regulator